MKTYLQYTSAYGLGVFTLSTLLAAAPSLAQEAASGPLQFSPIMVTGEKVERDLKDTASAVSVKGAQEIEREKTGSASVQEVINDIPNLIYTDTVAAPIIRGQDTQGPHNGQNVFWGGTVPRATINLDGHYLNYNEMYYGATSVWDVDSIEVFRGPQTTSQGANAIAGAIVVNTKDPTFTPEAAYQAELGSYNAKRTSLAVSGPFSEDFAGRLALDYSARDTFIDYRNPGFQQGKADQDFRALNARAKLLWLPSAIPGLQTKFTYAHSDYNRPSSETATGSFHELNHVGTTLPSWEQDTNTSVLDVSYDFDNGMRLFNQTQYSRSHVQRFTGIAGNGEADIEQKNVSNETRLSFGDQQSELSGFAGVYVARTKSDERLLLTGLTTFDDEKENLGVFGELSYRLSDRWTLTTGLRYQQDKVDRQGTSPLASTPLDHQKTFSAVLPKVSLAFAVTPDWTLGAMVSKGYNPGGVSLNLGVRPGKWQYFDEESVWNYELFSRAHLLDNRLILSGNLFYMDHKDAQYNIPVVVSPTLTQSYTINAEKAHAYGLELSADYQLLDSLRLRASAGTLRTRIDKVSSNVAYEDNEFAKSPGYSLTFGPSWDITDRWNLSAQVRHLDGYYSDTANTKSYAVDSYTLTDLRSSYRFSDALELYGYVKNVFDDRSPTYLQAYRGVGADVEASMTTPRMVGVGVKGSF